MPPMNSQCQAINSKHNTKNVGIRCMHRSMIIVFHDADVVKTSNAKMLVNSANEILNPLAAQVILFMNFG